MQRLFMSDVMARTGRTRRTLYAWMEANQFPKPEGKYKGKLWWRPEVIDQWLAEHSQDQHAAEVRWLPAGMAATIEDAAAALVGLDPEAAWRRMFDMANHAAEAIGRANPHKSVAEVQNLVAIFTRCVRRRALEVEQQRRGRFVQ